MPHIRLRLCDWMRRVRASRKLPLACACLLASLLAAGEARAQAPRTTSADLLSAGPDALARWFEGARPTPLSAERRARVLATLPAQGEVTALTPLEAAKRAAIVSLLDATSRRNTHVVMVIDLPQAAVAVYERSVVLVTRHALGILAADELVAVTAHELGHEYAWSEWVDARARGDRRRLQDLELVADIAGAFVLRAIGRSLTPLVSGIEKLTRANAHQFGTTNPEEYPSLSRRRHAILTVDRQFGAR